MAYSASSDARERRKKRIRKKDFGTPERPRLTIFRTNSHMYAQIVDDLSGSTLAAASTLESSLSDASGNVAGAEKVGELVAERAKAVGITAVVFDRGGNLYHGRIAALADAARKAGLEF